jgi:molecular chaperone GrpE
VTAANQSENEPVVSEGAAEAVPSGNVGGVGGADMTAQSPAETGAAAETDAPVEGEIVDETAVPSSGDVTIDLDITPVAADEEPVEAEVVEEVKKEDGESDGQPVYVELEALRGDLDELTRDLQRVTAEYANYRKRVDRDRTLISEQATGSVLTSLLPVLDDLDRARNHGDLVGPFAAVADQLNAALSKFGLSAFGEKGDPFDPTLHEAVSHMSSPDVTETTCVEVMRRGYLLGERLLRPALVAVADPE